MSHVTWICNGRRGWKWCSHGVAWPFRFSNVRTEGRLKNAWYCILQVTAEGSGIDEELEAVPGECPWRTIAQEQELQWHAFGASRHSNPISQVRTNSCDDFRGCWPLLEISTVSQSFRSAPCRIVLSSVYVTGLGVASWCRRSTLFFFLLKCFSDVIFRLGFQVCVWRWKRSSKLQWNAHTLDLYVWSLWAIGGQTAMSQPLEWQDHHWCLGADMQQHSTFKPDLTLELDGMYQVLG